MITTIQAENHARDYYAEKAHEPDKSLWSRNASGNLVGCYKCYYLTIFSRGGSYHWVRHYGSKYGNRQGKFSPVEYETEQEAAEGAIRAIDSKK